jgi:type II secretory pathway pseudopilin PulG
MTREKSPIAKSSSSGFTLAETAIVIVIAGAMAVAGIALVKSWVKQATLTANQQHLIAIQQALANYVAQHNRLPCPASYIAQTGDVAPKPLFGREDLKPAATTCNTPDSVNTFPETNPTRLGGPITDNNIVIGAVPVRDLGLPDTFQKNTYGYLLTYAVSQAATIAPLDASAGVIEVKDNGDNDVLPKPPASQSGTGTALYVLVDHGHDGKGAYTGVVTGPAIACPATGSTQDSYNCNFETGGYTGFRNAPFSSQLGTTYFDDLIAYNTNFSTGSGSQACVTKRNTTLSTPGKSWGHYTDGVDAGGGPAIGFIFAYFYVFGDPFTMNDSFKNYSSVSPTAAAYCDDASYHVVSGGCTQTNGADASTTNGSVTNAFGSDINYGGFSRFNKGRIPIPPALQIHTPPMLCLNFGCPLPGICFNFGCLIPAVNTPPSLPAPPAFNISFYQTVTPPLSHPALPGSTGVQGWECNGSSARGMQTQAYAVCCR